MNEKLTRPAFVVAVALVVLPAVAAAQSSGGTHEWDTPSSPHTRSPNHDRSGTYCDRFMEAGSRN